MAPTNRTSLRNASKAFRTIIASPASFIRKRLRRDVPKRNLKLALSPLSNAVCSHKPVGIGKFAEDEAARALCDLFTEDASSYADWAGMFLDELGDRLAAMSRMWEPALEVMKAGTGFSRSDHNTLRKFHFQTLANLSEMAESVTRSNWSKPRVKLSCRYHQDLDEIYFQICHCHEDIRRLVGFIGSYIEKCETPTVLYGVKCRLDVRIKLRDVDIEFDRAIDALQQTRRRFEDQLEQLFEDLRKTSSAISEYLAAVRESAKAVRGNLA
ncbi:uncharacterized protein LOC100902579 [Galendromus occidentalis]|uniref:Uncharacterized protein LOC100902579 n=1 Tax=Galendromus occidentalis TaxID=34638 RepID=A0AAJ6VVF8_9ACAR|nr:uncharacterized protein LOC100902579 [Galendromus occidentalis]